MINRLGRGVVGWPRARREGLDNTEEEGQLWAVKAVMRGGNKRLKNWTERREGGHCTGGQAEKEEGAGKKILHGGTLESGKSRRAEIGCDAELIF